MLLTKGLIRIGLPVPSGAEFTLAQVDDPYHFAGATELSLFRRPPPITNLAFSRTLMWDGRETSSAGKLHNDLGSQANTALISHQQGSQLTKEQREAIVRLELSLFSAQIFDQEAGELTDAGALGGPRLLVEQVKTSLATYPPAGPVFRLFESWATAEGPFAYARRRIARGESLFNRLPCASCHSLPNVGNNAAGMLFDVGVSAAARRAPEMPLYTFQCHAGPMAGRVIESTDPGQGLVTGRCTDIGKFKVPTLRGVANHPPYFHDGSAASLDDVIEFHDRYLRLGLSTTERRDLAAFLRAL